MKKLHKLSLVLPISILATQNLNASGEGTIMNLSDDNHFSSGLRQRSISSAPIEVKHTYHKPSKQDLAQDLYTQGMKYVKTRDSYEKAFGYLTEAASMDHPKAQYNLGVLYEFGLGVEQSLKDAAIWYSQSKSNGYGEADPALTRVIKKQENSF